MGKTSVSITSGLHPASEESGLIMNEKAVAGDHIMVTLHLWKKGDKAFTKKELTPVKDVKVAEDLSCVEVTFADNTVKQIKY